MPSILKPGAHFGVENTMGPTEYSGLMLKQAIYMSNLGVPQNEVLKFLTN